jgi:hypothetical protein
MTDKGCTSFLGYRNQYSKLVRKRRKAWAPGQMQKSPFCSDEELGALSASFHGMWCIYCASGDIVCTNGGQISWGTTPLC